MRRWTVPWRPWSARRWRTTSGTFFDRVDGDDGEIDQSRRPVKACRETTISRRRWALMVE